MTPPFEWDHTVHYVNDLDEAIRSFGTLGLRAFRGGSHTTWGTHNALSYFGLTYHEFLAVENRPLAEKMDRSNMVVWDAARLLPQHEVLHRVALRTKDIDAVHGLWAAQGLQVGPVLGGKRLNPQGRWVEWRMFTVGGDCQGLPFPFVIQWEQPDAERLEQLTASGILQPHPAGPVALARGVFEVADPAGAADLWGRLLGIGSVPSGSGFTLTLHDKSFEFVSGPSHGLVRLEFLTTALGLAGQELVIGAGRYRFHSR